MQVNQNMVYQLLGFSNDAQLAAIPAWMQSQHRLTYQRLPSGEVQIEILDPSCILRCVSGQQYHCVLCLDRHKAQGKDIPAATVVALENSVPKRTVLVQLYLLQLGFDLRRKHIGWMCLSVLWLVHVKLG